MSEMIKEVTPVRNLDVSNPYQAASPVKYASGMKAKPKPVRRTRASGRPSAPPEPITINGKVEDANEKEKEKEEKEMAEKYTARAIFEASVPKVRVLLQTRMNFMDQFVSTREANVLVLQPALAKDFPMVFPHHDRLRLQRRPNLTLLKSRKLKTRTQKISANTKN
jgi:hypothetical protein